MSNVRNFRWQHWLLIFGLAFSLALTGFFIVRAVHYAPHPLKDEPIRPWMNIPYIAHSYRVPSHILYQALGLPSLPRDRRPILEIARQQRRTVESIIITMQEAITQYRLSVTPVPTISPGLPESTP